MADFASDPGWLPFLPVPSRPLFTPPVGAVDAHCHVFGPGDQFPYAPERRYTPCDASKQQLLALRDRLGFYRNVIVQASCHGTDNRALVDALVAADGRARGVATIRPETTDAELAWLHGAGVRAVRFTFIPRLTDPKPDDYYWPIVKRIADLGWHVVVYAEATALLARRDFLAALPTVVVVDHMGRPDVRQSVDSDQFEQFIRLLDDHRNIWTKVSCPERLSVTGPPGYDDVVPFASRLVEQFPDRVLWGTDWPHPNMRSHMPDDGQLVDMIPRIAPTEELQHALLVDNPTRLYWEE